MPPDDDDTAPPQQDKDTTSEDFHNAVQQLVVEAIENGVEVYGRWPVVGETRNKTWAVEIREVNQTTKVDVNDSTQLIPVIVEVIADRENAELMNLPPLSQVINPDALELLFQSESDRTSITFPYCDYQITVQANGTIFVDRLISVRDTSE